MGYVQGVYRRMEHVSRLLTSYNETNNDSERTYQASTGVISPSRFMLDDKFNNSFMIAPLAVQVWLSCGPSSARATSGVDAIIMWLAGSVEGGSAREGICCMHGCSSARTKSMAVSIVSTRAELLTSAASTYPDDTLMGWREKSCRGFSCCDRYGQESTNRSGSLVQTECSGGVHKVMSLGSRIPDWDLVGKN